MGLSSEAITALAEAMVDSMKSSLANADKRPPDLSRDMSDGVASLIEQLPALLSYRTFDHEGNVRVECVFCKALATDDDEVKNHHDHCIGKALADTMGEIDIWQIQAG